MVRALVELLIVVVVLQLLTVLRMLAPLIQLLLEVEYQAEAVVLLRMIPMLLECLVDGVQ